ncbi:SLBB domain-containing protein [Parapedobacter luteus]|nr:SLBB domain-containing protein [Parapedobacter luteus]
MKRSILLLIGFLWLITTQAQTQSQTKSQNQSQSQSQQQQPPVQLSDISKVRVDQLSDEQITKIMTDAEKRGLTDDQLLQALAQRGMPAAEQQKLRSRMAALRQKGSPVGKRAAAMPTPMDQQGRQVVDTTTAFVDSLMIVEEEADTSRIFGAKLFRNTNIQFQPNLNIPTPKNYVIGTGDELLIDVTGDNEESYRLTVSPEGTINIDYVGIISVGGLTIEDATSKLKQQLQSIYSRLRTGGTRLSLTLGNIRSIKVTLTGYVTRPGTYTLPSLANVFHALYASGGPSDKGTYRGIQLIRNNRVIETIDTYDFLTKGIQPGNVRLEDGDVIHIPVFNRHVTVDGLVNNPGIFEPVESETLEDVLRFAGDFSPEAYRAKVKVLQVTDRQRSVADIYAEDFSSYTPRNGDHYIVEEVLDRYANRVAIEGAVFRPGLYALTDGLTLRELIRRADGLKEDAFMSRAYINRLNPDNTQQLITVDLAQLMAGSTQQDHVLQREDKVIISSIFDLREEYTVSISGQVRKPGEFEYVEQMTLGNLIQMSGGLAEAANIEYIDVARRIRRNTNERDSTISELVRVSFDSREEAVQSDFVLQPFDMVSVHTSTGYQVQRLVRIEGEVMYPGEYVLLKKDEKVSDLIRRAGGVTEFAYLQGASLQRKASDAMVSQSHGALTSQDQQKLDELEQEQRELQSLALENIAEAGTNTELFFSNYVGIHLDKILAGNRKYDIPLEDEDVIVVPRQLRTVTVRGQVLNPNRVVYQKGKPLRYYINQAGGFTSKAHKRKTFVQHANGAVEGSRGGYPEVLPGSEIIVPTRPDRERIPAQAWVSMASVITSMAAVIVSLLR